MPCCVADVQQCSTHFPAPTTAAAGTAATKAAVTAATATSRTAAAKALLVTMFLMGAQIESGFIRVWGLGAVVGLL